MSEGVSVWMTTNRLGYKSLLFKKPELDRKHGIYFTDGLRVSVPQEIRINVPPPQLFP